MSLAPVAPVRNPETEEATEEATGTDEVVSPDVPWVTIVWNDPVNLMTYVTWVFETYFGYPRAKAEKLMIGANSELSI